MLSRIADSLYWLDRYMERTDAMIRNVKTNYILSFDTELNILSSWRQVLNIFGHLPEEEKLQFENNTQETLRFLITDASNPNSVRTIIQKARENARGAQDHITKEVWEEVNRVYHLITDPVMEERLAEETLKVLDELTECTTMYYGVTSSTMPRGNGWHFMNLGKYVERTLVTLDVSLQHFGVIHNGLDEQRDIVHWRNLLLSLSGYELHLKTYRSKDHDRNVVHQVLFNPDFTRSAKYSLHKIRGYLARIVDYNEPQGKEQLLNQFGRMYSRIEYADADQLQHRQLEDFMKDTRLDMIRFHSMLGQTFFSYQ